MNLAVGEAKHHASPRDRRAFLRGCSSATLSLGAVALLAGADALAATSPVNPPRDVAILNVAMSAEYLAIAAYDYCARCGLLGRDLAGIAHRFQAHHRTHCGVLVDLIRKMGGQPMAMGAQADYESQLKVQVLTRQDQVLAMAIRLELSAINAYMNAIPALDHTDLARVVGRIAADEAAHYSALSSALGVGIRSG